MKRLVAAAAFAAFATSAAPNADAADPNICVEGAYPPFSEMNAEGKVVGFDIDIANALCGQMGKSCEMVQSEWDGIIPALLERKCDAIIASMSITEDLQLRIYRSGLTIRPHILVGLCVALGLGSWFVGSLIFPNPVIAIALLGVGLLPWLYVLRLARRRKALFEEQFLEALELMTRALRAGHSLSLAFQMVGEELTDPVAAEFAYMSEEIKLGQEVRTALANLAYRVDGSDLPFFITAVLIQRETGGNLAEILEKLNYVIRERFKLYGKVRSMTAIGRMSANLLAAWPPGIVLALAASNIDYVSPLWTTPTGHMLSWIAALLVLVGYVVCRRLAIIKV